jgi:hypothetical protein
LYQQDQDVQDDIENADQEFLDFLRPFTAVKDIYLCETSAQQIAIVLRNEVVERGFAEVLPTLQNLFLNVVPPSGPTQGIVTFVAIRELFGHHITVSLWPAGDGRADN